MTCEIEEREGWMRIATILTGENWTEINIHGGGEQANTTKDDSIVA
jgi:hypothetical protein